MIIHSMKRTKSLQITKNKIYSRDTIPYMKPDDRSFNDVQNDISYRYPVSKTIFFLMIV